MEAAPRPVHSPAADPRVALGAIVLVALALRLVNNVPSFTMFWYDEAEYALRARLILEAGGAYPLERLFDHPPLVPYLVAGAFALLGEAWWSARAVSVLAGVLAVPVAYLAGRTWRDGRTGLIAAAIMALAPLSVYVTRMLVLEPVLGLAMGLALLALARMHRDAEAGRSLAAADILLLAGASAAAFLAKATAVALLPAVLWSAWRLRLHTSGRAWAAAGAAACLVLPVYALLLGRGILRTHGERVADASSYTVGDLIVTTPHGASLLALLLLANVLLVPAGLGAWRSVRARDVFGTSLALFTGGVLVILLLVTLYAPHYSYAAMPALALLAAEPMARMRRANWAVLGALALVSLAGVASLFAMTSLHEAQEFVLDRAQPGDAVLASDPPVFAFARPGEPVLGADADSLAERPRFLVLHFGDVARLESEPAFQEYEHVHVARAAWYEGHYHVYEHMP